MQALPENMNHLWSALLMEELHRHGVQTVCIAPGSRSTPLTWAAADHPALETLVHIDERGLGFHALGIAKASNRPVALVCTSGSAVANLLPAVVEASMSRVPLILFTADRPPELIDCGANQAINQTRIFGDYVRQEIQLSCPSVEVPPHTILEKIGTAIAQATGLDAGPVHINCPFREPLSPESDGTDIEAYLKPLTTWRVATSSFTEPPTHPTPTPINNAFWELCAATHGLLIVGQIHTAQETLHVETLATQLGWPVITDIATPFRLSGFLDHHVAFADQLLHTQFRTHLEETHCILHIGGALVSKRIQAFIESQAPKPYVRMTPGSLLMDPGHCSTLHLPMNALDTLQEGAIVSHIDAPWRDTLLTLSDTVGCFFSGQFSSNTISEPDVIRAITETEATTLFFGNSMPIRDADMFGAPFGYVITVHANRGASGIDGNIATVAGIAHATGSVTAVLGDLAALHDLNSLALLRANKVVLVIINNAGGGIFSFLPIAEQGKYVTEFFTTPHTQTFDAAAAMYNIAYERPETLSEFQAAYEEALTCGTSTIIEVNTNRDENVRVHRALEANLIEYMNGVEL